MKVTQIVAVDRNFCIGKGNALAWDVPTDMKHFRERTKGAVVLMGRKTFESIGRPLPNRENWILTTDLNWSHEGVKVEHSLHHALLHIQKQFEKAGEDGELFIIGGAEIYKQSMPFSHELIITHIDTKIEGGDAFYPSIPPFMRKVSSVVGTDEQSGLGLEFAVYSV